MAEIRPYRPGDEDGINAVIRSVFEEYGWAWAPDSENHDTYEIEAYYLEHSGAFWVLTESDKIIGTVALMPRHGDLCVLKRVYLLRAHRGQGHGKCLLKHAVEEARRRGYQRMEIWSDKTLDVSHVMYRNVGAELLGEKRVYDPAYGYPYEEWGYMLDLEKAKL